MIVATLNVRGVGGPVKSLTLKRFLETTKPDVLFIQETMVCEAKARDFLSNYSLIGIYVGWTLLVSLEDC
jgi:exonuclease III